MRRETRYTIEFFVTLFLLVAAATWLAGCSGPMAPSSLPVVTVVSVPVVAPAQPVAVTPIAVSPDPPAPSVTTLHLQNRDTGRPVRMAEISVDGAYLGTSDVSGNFVLTVGGAMTVYHGEYAPWHGTVTLTGAVVTIALTPLR